MTTYIRRKDLIHALKLGTMTHTLTVKRLRAVGGQAGRVILTARETSTGIIVDNNVVTFQDVEVNGLPVPELFADVCAPFGKR